MASLLFAFRHIQCNGDIGQVGEFENRDAERASREQAPWRRRMPLFVCLFVVCSGRFVAASVRYLTLFSRSRVFSQPPIISLSVFIFLSFYYSSCPPFYLSSLFLLSRIDPCKFTRSWNAGVTLRIFTVFNYHRYRHHFIVSSAFLLPLRWWPQGNTVLPPARTEQDACLPIYCYKIVDITLSYLNI